MPTPGGPDQREDRAAALVRDVALAPELAHREVLEDALLDLLEACVVGVEHSRAAFTSRLVGLLAPGQGKQPVEVGADRRRLGVAGAGAPEAPELAPVT